jgi:lycopene elongase/hydratase (dihydrobisanhydrobacterioruberin-forming)
MTHFLVRTSRPRFWLYLAGPYLVGYAAGIERLQVGFDPLFAAWLAYFLFPANVLLYGVNDLFDGDTDRFNPKKLDKENLLAGGEAGLLRRALAVVAVVTAVAVAASGSPRIALLWAAFIALAVGYSAPPLRLKARPVLDSASNILYGIPGFIGFYQSSGRMPGAAAVAAVFCWTAAMHLFSAVPDIDSDRRAGLRTTAVALGYRGSLAACAALWLAALAAGAWGSLAVGVAAAGIIYPAIPLWLALGPERRIGPVYWLFPYINAAAGFALFAAAFLPKLHA